jgi:hypothetical protein
VTVSSVSDDGTALVLPQPSLDGLSPDELVVDDLVLWGVADDFFANLGKLGVFKVSQGIVNLAWKGPGFVDVVFILVNVRLLNGEGMFLAPKALSLLADAPCE